ncbi:hypothetical protein PHMEG_000282 [Phytophthora megakarya]|uniref:Ribosome assembly protein 3 n=1 Tax=Phytophthora megakarya TaxID=4795 RepID=A0A225X3C6_9STRA|nr:hypothetical protein PHMEG_000282 [Phytophthora megakarya]
MDAKTARLTARFDRLIAALGEDVLHSSGGLCARLEDASSAVKDAATDEQRQKLLAIATDKSVRCAELIAKSLETSTALTKLQKTLKDAYNHRNDEDETVDSEEEQEEDEATTLLLQDLVAAGDELEDATKKYARLGVVRKTARASHELLNSAEHNLQEHLASEAATGDVQDEFQQLYMEEFTTAFGDDLNQFRQEERFESKDVTYLISCIHAGGDIFSPLQKKLFVESVAASRPTE